MENGEIFGYAASLLVFTSFLMKTMIPLRYIAIASNFAFIVYGLGSTLYPVLILHVTLLPLNVFRLWQIRSDMRKIERAAKNDLDFASLIPHMSRSRFRSGDMLFRAGDPADALYYIASGSVSFPEIGSTLTVGDVFGEIGLFSPERTRSATAEVQEDAEIYALSGEKIQELYYQNPAFGFTLIRLITARLLSKPPAAPGEERI
ncbi:MAG: cyclic nucleotide-binding domain-containing protein [Gammaproteobacteria bacterium]|nr:cyclic nucleotide-binding domain-containing protein [Gammaproteobacteria bacterium]